MSKPMPSTALMLGWVIVVAATAAASAGDEKTSAAEKVLIDKGLTKDDRKFLLDEKAAVEKYEDAKSAYADYQKALKRYMAIAEFDEAVQTLEAQRQELQQQADMLQTQLNNMAPGYGRMRQMVSAQQAPMRQQQSQARAMINQVNAQIQASRAQAPKADERKSVPAELEKTRKSSIDSVRELKEALDPLLAKYHELGRDKAVTDSLAQLRHKTTLNYKLGPSDQIVAASKLIHEGNKYTSVKVKPSSKKKTKTKGS